jgi:hypothetical protein
VTISSAVGRFPGHLHILSKWEYPLLQKDHFCGGRPVGYAIFGISYLTFGYEYHTTLYVCLAAILVGFCRDKTRVY